MLQERSPILEQRKINFNNQQLGTNFMRRLKLQNTKVALYGKSTKSLHTINC